MKENDIDGVVMFLVNNMISIRIKKNTRVTKVEFIDAINDHIMATLWISYRKNIEVVHDVLEYLCAHQNIYQELKNRVGNYYVNHEDSVSLFERLNILSNKTNHIRQTLMYEYGKKETQYNPNIDYIEFLLTKLTRRDISMSASFITQYAIKNIRATEDTENKTPEDIKNINDQIQGNVSILNSTKNKALEEECGDLNMCLDLLYHLEGNHPIEEFNTLDNPKWKRWAERLGFISF